MPIIAETFSGGGAGYSRGQAFWNRAAFQDRFQMPSPFSVARSLPRGTRAQYRSRLYEVGNWNANVLITEHRQMHRQGLGRPLTAPGLAAGAGATIQIGYQSFYDANTQEMGPLSAGTQVTGNLTRTWSALATVVPEEDIVMDGTVTLGSNTDTITGPDCDNTRFSRLRPGDRIALSSDPLRFVPIVTITDDSNITTEHVLLLGAAQTITARPLSRATHIDTWLSVNGASPRHVARRQIGCVGFTESTPTLDLGEAYPDTFERLPRGTMNAIFHDRQVVAGDAKHPDTAYLSAIGFPERWEGLSVKTRNGEPITLILGLRDMLLICSYTTAYILTGYTEDDMEVTVSEYELGAAGPNAGILIHGRGWIVNNKGIFLFNGAWQNMMVERSTEFIATYRANRLSFEGGFCVHNEDDKTFQFHPDIELDDNDQAITTDGSRDYYDLTSWIADYSDMEPEIGGVMSLPNWSNDTQIPASAAYLRDPKTGIGAFYRGRCDGKVYVEDDTANFLGTAEIGPRHIQADDPGGPIGEGKRHGPLWTYMHADVGPDQYLHGESPTAEWEVQIWPGDEHAGQIGYDPALPYFDDNSAAYKTLAVFQGVAPAWKRTHTNSQAVKSVDGDDYLMAPKTVWPDLPSMCSGRGFSMLYLIRNARRWIFRGFGGIILPGVASRRIRAKLPE